MLFVQYPSWISPQIVPFLPIRWYGLMYLLAYITGYMFILSQTKREKEETLREQLPNIFMWCFLGMILGGRLLSEIIYSENLAILIKPWLLIWPFRYGQFVGLQGMSYHGGLLGMAVAMIIYCKQHAISFGKLADKLAMGAALGYTFGRIGNFTNAELFGRITAQPWGMLFPNAEMLPIAAPNVKNIAEQVGLTANEFGLINLPRHPSQLYEALFEGIVTGIILYFIYRVVRRKKIYVPGTIISLYIVLYGIARFCIEYFRQPDSNLNFVIQLSDKPNPNWLFVSLLNITTGQILSAIMIVCGIIAMVILCLLYKRTRNAHKIPIKNKNLH